MCPPQRRELEKEKTEIFMCNLRKLFRNGENLNLSLKEGIHQVFRTIDTK